MPPIRKKQRGLLLKLQQEKVNTTFTFDCFELPHMQGYLANLGYSQKVKKTGQNLDRGSPKNSRDIDWIGQETNKPPQSTSFILSRN